jgi:hypothetical protein
MEVGEEIEVVCIVRAATLGALTSGSNYAVAATPKNVYVFKLGGLGFGKVAERIAKVAIKKAVVERGSTHLTVGRRGQEQPEYVFSTLPGGSPKRLAAYVAERNGTASA